MAESEAQLIRQLKRELRQCKENTQCEKRYEKDQEKIERIEQLSRQLDTEHKMWPASEAVLRG